MKRPWAFICANEGATSKHLRNYCREVYLLGYLPVCPKLQDSQYLVLEDAMERSEYTAIVRDMRNEKYSEELKVREANKKIFELQRTNSQMERLLKKIPPEVLEELQKQNKNRSRER